MEGGRRMEVRSWGSREWCYRVGERLVIKQNGICRGSRMNLLIKLCRNMRVRVRVPLKRIVLGRDRQA